MSARPNFLGRVERQRFCCDGDCAQGRDCPRFPSKAPANDSHWTFANLAIALIGVAFIALWALGVLG